MSDFEKILELNESREEGAVEVLPIALCLIVKNEADRLEACLRPLLGRFAEIIAYDNGSTDGTVEILKNMGVTVILGPWLGFSATRRAVWNMAKCPWVLWLDADEILPDELLADLKRVGTEEGVGGYRLCRQIIFEGRAIKHGDWTNDWVLRVFKKNAYTMAERLVHESVTVTGKVKDLKGTVAHYSFRDWADLEKRSQRYAQLWAQQAVAEGRRAKSPQLRAVFKFIRGYFLKSGWLDGAIGYKIALHNAREVFSKYSLLNAARRSGRVGPV